VGDIWAVGKTITQLDEELTEKLKEYIRYPEVSISIKKLGGKKIMVLGEVLTPGVYTVTGKKRVIEAIAMAGGFNSNAVVSSVIVIQGGLLNPKGIRLNLNRTLLKADFRHNILLNPDDIIFVPKKFIANVNYLVNSIVGPIAQGTFNTEQLYHKRW
jgi:polysaccharide export outer membrane protein